jgi:preprotein translocase subunit SecA
MAANNVIETATPKQRSDLLSFEIMTADFAWLCEKQATLLPSSPSETGQNSPSALGSKFRQTIESGKEKVRERIEKNNSPDSYRPIVEKINALGKEFHNLSDEQLKAKTGEFKTRFNTRVTELVPKLQGEINSLKQQYESETDGKKLGILKQLLEAKEKKMLSAEKTALDELLPEAFAAVREAADRKIHLRHFDCQLIGGMALHDGKIAEMKTGEGKTLVATLPLYLNALAGHGVHLVTPNDYLSKVGAQWMGQVYEVLGMSVGLIEGIKEKDQPPQSFIFDGTYRGNDENHLKLKPATRKEAYLADITYGTNNEFGFDYLRDNMYFDVSECVQREPHFAIVDEVDNILIDEARTPLIMSGPGEDASQQYQQFNEIVKKLTASTNGDNKDEEPNGDFVINRKTREVTLTESGIEKVQQLLGITDLYEIENNGENKGESKYGDLLPYLDNVLRANVVYEKDKDYIVKEGEIVIVDDFTGRLMPGRRYSAGLHQALEAKEGLTVKPESVTYAEITFQNLFRKYKKLAGMTGTAMTAQEEFRKVYNLEVVEIPPNKPVIRTDEHDFVFQTKEEKLQAILEDITDCYKRGQPVLIGTPKIDDTEELHTLLEKAGIPHKVLNAKEHEKEGLIIAEAGRSGAVTIATNMAGRGVDILLGGNPELLARERLKEKGVDLTNISNKDLQAEIAITAKFCQEDKQKVIAAGGLRVVGTARHESRRIDNQLRGRGGRQGDPGSSRFYLSAKDELIVRFGGAFGQQIGRVAKFMKKNQEQPEGNFVTDWTFEKAQETVEGYNFDIRKHVLEYDTVIDAQRETFYRDRKKIIEATDLIPIAANVIGQSAEEKIDEAYADNIVWKGENKTIFEGFNVQNFWQSTWEKYQKIIPPQIIEQLSVKWAMKLNDALKSPNAENEIEKQLPGIAEDVKSLLQQSLLLNQELWEQTGNGWSKEKFQQLLKFLLLKTIGDNWTIYMTDIEKMRQGIGLRAFGERNPVTEYKKVANQMFSEFNEANVQDSRLIIENNLIGARAAISNHLTFDQATRPEQTQEQQQKIQEVTAG